VELPDSEIPPRGEIEARLKQLRERRSFIDGLIGDLEYLQKIYPFVLEQQNKFLSIEETAVLVTGQKRKDRGIKLLKEFVSSLDAEGDAWEKENPAPVSPFGKTSTRMRLAENVKRNEPFWTRELCLAIRPKYSEWHKKRSRPKRRRRPKKF
jgi:hypothetical protein